VSIKIQFHKEKKKATESDSQSNAFTIEDILFHLNEHFTSKRRRIRWRRLNLKINRVNLFKSRVNRIPLNTQFNTQEYETKSLLRDISKIKKTRSNKFPSSNLKWNKFFTSTNTHIHKYKYIYDYDWDEWDYHWHRCWSLLGNFHSSFICLNYFNMKISWEISHNFFILSLWAFKSFQKLFVCILIENKY
jgi:hypothetical protein